MFARFDEIPSITLYDINETVYTNAIQNYRNSPKYSDTDKLIRVADVRNFRGMEN